MVILILQLYIDNFNSSMLQNMATFHKQITFKISNTCMLSIAKRKQFVYTRLCRMVLDGEVVVRLLGSDELGSEELHIRSSVSLDEQLT